MELDRPVRSTRDSPDLGSRPVWGSNRGPFARSPSERAPTTTRPSPLSGYMVRFKRYKSKGSVAHPTLKDASFWFGIIKAFLLFSVEKKKARKRQRWTFYLLNSTSPKADSRRITHSHRINRYEWISNTTNGFL